MPRLSYAGRALAALITIVAVLGLSGAPSLAAVSIVAVRVDAQPTGGVLVTVQFVGTTPKWRVVGAGTTETAVIFDEATLGPTVPPTVAGSGTLTSVSTAQTGTSASVSLHLSASAPVRVRQAGPSTLFIDVQSNGRNAPAASAAVSATSGSAGEVTEIVSLKYADISEVAGVLVSGSNVASTDNFNPQIPSLGSSSLGGSFGGTSGTGGGFSQPTQTFGGGFGQPTGLAQRLNDTIAVDRRLNAIIITATPEVIAQYKALIAKIDVPLESVVLETQIVELDENASRDVGFSLAQPGGTAVGTLTYAAQSLQTSQAVANLQATLYATIIKGDGRIIAKPRILAQSGSSASILTGDAIPIITQVVVTGSSALTSQQVNYVNVGVSLQIQPRVSSDGYVTSHIFSEVSSVTGYTQGVPTISQRQAYTTATVRDGESFVIGGLLQDNEIRSLTKLAFVGDLPLIGQFFRYWSTSHSQTNLYVVVTPHVVRRNEPPPLPPGPQPTISPTSGLVDPPAVPVPVPNSTPTISPGPGNRF
jgi:general secretion pathway protein D